LPQFVAGLEPSSIDFATLYVAPIFRHTILGVGFEAAGY
jgi:hypothetical protein